MKIKLSLTFRIFITIGILLFIFFTLNINLLKVFHGIVNINYLFLVSIIPLVILPVISANRWKLFLKQVGIFENTFSLMKINFISIFQGLILPSSQGQDVLRIYYIERLHPENRGSAGSTIVVERMIGFVILCLLSLFSTAFYKEIPDQKLTLTIILTITLTLFVIIALLLNKRLCEYLNRISFSSKFLQKGFGYLNKLYKAVAYFPYRKVIISSFILILLFQISTVFCIYLIFKSFGHSIPFYQHLSLYPIISILSMVPITISGFGIRESFFVYFYTKLGVDAETAIMVSLVNYMIIVLTPTLIGSILYLFESSAVKNDI